MVFGWGKKKEPEMAPEPEVRKLALGDVEYTIAELYKLRSKTLVTEAASLKKSIEGHMKEMAQIAGALEGDDLNLEEVDRHLRTIVERGKSQVLEAIKEETSSKMPGVMMAADAAKLNERTGRLLKRIGDVLGRQTRVIHLFAKKYAAKLKTILGSLKDEKDALQNIVTNHLTLESEMNLIRERLRKIEQSRAEARSKSKLLKAALLSSEKFAEKSRVLEAELQKIRASERYAEFMRLEGQLEGLEPERRALRRQVNDQFTKISRPLGKYEYVSALDKDQKMLLRKLVSDPFEALDPAGFADISSILEQVRRGVEAGSISVKDASKAVQLIGETAGLLESMVQKKKDLVSKHEKLRSDIDSLNMGEYEEKTMLLEKTKSDIKDEEARTARLRSEMAEAEARIPALISEISRSLESASSIRYKLEDF